MLPRRLWGCIRRAIWGEEPAKIPESHMNRLKLIIVLAIVLPVMSILASVLESSWFGVDLQIYAITVSLMFVAVSTSGLIIYAKLIKRWQRMIPICIQLPNRCTVERRYQWQSNLG